MEDIKNNKERQIDIVWLIRYFWAKRWLIGKVVFVAVVLCVILNFSKSKRFTATASLMPISEGTMSGGGLGSLASIAGIDLGAGSSEIITSDLYPKVVRSTPFLLEVMNYRVPWTDTDTAMSIYEHVVADTLPSFSKTLYKYTIGLYGTLMRAITPETPDYGAVASSGGKKREYLALSKKQFDVIKSVKQIISIESDAFYGTIELSVEGETPVQASLLATKVISLLQQTVTEHKTRRAKVIYDFIESRYNEATVEYEKIRNEFFAYRDSHRHMVAERVDAEYQRLSDQYQLSYSILKSLSSQMEQAKLEILADTPVFSVVEPVVIPEKKSSPKLSLHLAAGILLGFFCVMGWLLGRIAWYQAFNEEKYIKLLEEYKK